MSTIVMEIALALYYIFPAYCANAIPVLFGGGRPIDNGRVFLDGKPLFGAHKTLRGFFAGLLIGTGVGALQSMIGRFLLTTHLEYPLLLGFTISLGAMLGDLLDSFFKRRLNLSPGAAFPVMDQLDFVLGALIFSLFLLPPSPRSALIIMVITPPIHLVTNFVAYHLGVKGTPW